MRTALHARAARQGDPCCSRGVLGWLSVRPGAARPRSAAGVREAADSLGLARLDGADRLESFHLRATDERRPTFPGPEARRDQLIAALAQHSPDYQELRADSPTLELVERREILRAGIDEVLVRRASGQVPSS